MQKKYSTDLIKRRLCYAVFSRPAHIVESAWIIFAAIALIAVLTGFVPVSLELGIGIAAISSFLLGASVSLIYNYDNVHRQNRIDDWFLDGFWFGERTFASYLVYRKVLSSFGHKCSRADANGIAELASRFMRAEGFEERLAEWNCSQVVKKMETLGFSSYVSAYLTGVPIDDLVFE